MRVPRCSCQVSAGGVHDPHCGRRISPFEAQDGVNPANRNGREITNRNQAGWFLAMRAMFGWRFDLEYLRLRAKLRSPLGRYAR
jgi:hypothetical protein